MAIQKLGCNPWLLAMALVHIITLGLMLYLIPKLFLHKFSWLCNKGGGGGVFFDIWSHVHARPLLKSPYTPKKETMHTNHRLYNSLMYVYELWWAPRANYFEIYVHKVDTFTLKVKSSCIHAHSSLCIDNFIEVWHWGMTSICLVD